ncbi:MAG: hypothetical protein AAGH83_10935 [Pseudomonadota bacterium]
MYRKRMTPVPHLSAGRVERDWLTPAIDPMGGDTHTAADFRESQILSADDPTVDPTDEDAARIAYELAEDLIAQAKADRATFLKLADGPDFLDNVLTSRGDYRFSALERLPPQIAELTDLQDLVLSGTQICDMAPLSELIGLRALYLDNTNVDDLSALQHLRDLKILLLDGTPAAARHPILKAISRISEDEGPISDAMTWLRERGELGPKATNTRTRDSMNDKPFMASLERTPTFAESDYNISDDGSELIEVPLKGDVPDIEDAYRMRQQADRLSTLSDLARELWGDLGAELPNIPKALRPDLKRYADETGKDPNQVRPPYLRGRVAYFTEALKDPGLRGALSNYDLSKFDDLVREHEALMASVYSAQIERIRRAEAEPLPPGTTVGALKDGLDQALALTTGPDWANYPKMPPDLIDQISGECDALREEENRLPLITDAEERAAAQERLAKRGRVSLATIGQAVGRAQEWVAANPGVRAVANLSSISAFLYLVITLLG